MNVHKDEHSKETTDGEFRRFLCMFYAFKDNNIILTNKNIKKDNQHHIVNITNKHVKMLTIATKELQ